MDARTVLRKLASLRLTRRAATSFLEGAAVAAGFFGGLGLVAIGVGMVHAAAGVIVGGVELATCAVLYARGHG
jgi:hypothetical protein